MQGLVDRVEIHTECVEKYLTHPSVEITKACIIIMLQLSYLYTYMYIVMTIVTLCNYFLL